MLGREFQGPPVGPCRPRRVFQRSRQQAPQLLEGADEVHGIGSVGVAGEVVEGFRRAAPVACGTEESRTGRHGLEAVRVDPGGASEGLGGRPRIPGGFERMRALALQGAPVAAVRVRGTQAGFRGGECLGVASVLRQDFCQSLPGPGLAGIRLECGPEVCFGRRIPIARVEFPLPGTQEQGASRSGRLLRRPALQRGYTRVHAARALVEREAESVCRFECRVLGERLFAAFESGLGLAGLRQAVPEQRQEARRCVVRLRDLLR